jgi:excinuclease ABC subunit A
MQLASKGFLRVWIDGKIQELEQIPMLATDKKHTIKLIVDGLRVKPEAKARLIRSIENVISASEGILEWFPTDPSGQMLMNQGGRYSLKAGCLSCGYAWPKLDPRYFSANSLGRCPGCAGRGYAGLSAAVAAQWDEAREAEDSDATFADLDVRDESLCPACGGTGLDSPLAAVRLRGRSILDLHGMSLGEVESFTCDVASDPVLGANPAAVRVLDELMPICRRLNKVGLSYLGIGRRLFTLSAGELQRIKLAGILGGRLRGVLYVLDEPSQGLHHTEVEQIAKTLVELKEDGSTVIVVDHDEGFMRYADWIIDLGPGGGREGGSIVAKFRPKDAGRYLDISATARQIHDLSLSQNAKTGERVDPVKANLLDQQPVIYLYGGDRQVHNLKIPVARFPLHKLTVVTGVSGAGKSSLVLDTLFPRLKRWVAGDSKEKALLSPLIAIVGAGDGDSPGKDLENVELIDRRKIAKSGVSIPASYLDVLGDLRDLYASLPDAQVLGLAARSFSLAVEGGRCTECKGRGVISLKMRFLADAQVVCPLCRGERFTSQVLSVRYLGHSLVDLLEMSLAEVAELLANHKKITAKLAPALALGLGYLKLGQPTSSLSGGEAQRLKLVPHFYQGIGGIKKRLGRGTVLIMDEPTTGLHREDVRRLLKVIQSMVVTGTTVIAIEHHPEVISAADWNLDIGPEAADRGGTLVYEGPPKSIH